MRLVFNRPRRAEERDCEPEVVQREGGAYSRTGAFNPHGIWEYQADTGEITITFSPAIYLNNTLSPEVREQVLEHERGHLDDYLDLTDTLASDIRGALRGGGTLSWEDMRLRWQWFNYDICVAEGRYHRSIGQDARVCTPPDTPRPAWASGPAEEG